MIDPYRMVIVSFISLFFVVIITLFYTFIYPKKKLNLLTLLILFSIPPIINIFRPGSYESGDFTIHIYRTIEFYRSLTEGILFPSWAANLNATYGYALFILNYPLPYYIISFFHFLGFSFIASMKLFLAVNFLLSGIFMYLCTKKLFRNDIAAFTASIFYQFTPYHLIDLHFKVVIGEILIFTLIPLTFFFLQKLLDQKNGLWFSLTSLCVALLIMAHVVLALFALVLFFAYALLQTIQTKERSKIILTTTSFIAGSISSLYIWLTPFFMTQYTLFKTVTNFVYFPELWELLYSPWRFGLLFQGSQGELSFLLGYTQITAILSVLFLLIRKKIHNRHRSAILFWLVTFFTLIFLISPYSKFLWGLFPFLKITGSHRLLVIVAFVSSVLAGYLSIYLLKRRALLTLLIALTILVTILNWGHRRVIPEITDTTLINNVWKSTSQSEGHFYANSKWRSITDPWFSKLPNAHIEIIQGKGETREVNRTSTKHTYQINAQTPIMLRENTLYFPGWKVISNTTVIVPEPDENGIITFMLPKGLQLVEVIYDDLTIYKILKMISISGFVTLMLSSIIFWKRAYER